MKNITALIALSFLIFSFSFIEQQIFDYHVSNDFTLKIKGTSNVHDWESSVEKMSGTASISFSESGDLRIDACSVSIPVLSIVSTKGSIMDKKTWKALDYTNNPNIDYSLTAFTYGQKTGSSFTANTTGNLTIAGTTKVVNMEITVRNLSNGNVEIKGSKKLKMTDFGIDPPTALFGTMTTGNDITVVFQTVLSKD